MPVLQTAHGWLALAIMFEVAGTSMLMKTEQFSKLWPTLATGALYAASFFFLTHALKGIPVGIAYALWGGLGIVLVAMIGVVAFRQTLDAPAMIGIGLIVSGVVVMNMFSNAATH